MNTKVLSAIFLSLFLAVMTVSAVSFTTSPGELLLSESVNQTALTVTNTGNDTMNVSLTIPANINDGNGNLVSVHSDYTGQFSLASGASRSITLFANSADIGSGFGFLSNNGDNRFSSTVSVMGSDVTDSLNSTVILTFATSYCEDGQVNNSLFRISKVSVSGTRDSDDFDWYPYDELTLEIKVKNDDNEDHSVVVEWDIYDVEEEEFLDEGSDESIDIDEGDSETLEFNFDVPFDLEKSTSRYKLFVKVYDDDEGEDNICSSSDEDGRTANLNEEEGIPIVVKRESREISVVRATAPDTLTCGSSDSIDLTIANTGAKDEEKVEVVMLASDLTNNVELSEDIKNLDFDDKSVLLSFPITVPLDADEQEYRLSFKVYYDYDDKNDEFDIVDTHTVPVTVSGGCIEPTLNNVEITAELLSDEVKAGNEVVIRTTIKNIGSSTERFSLGVEGNSDWSETVSIDPVSATLASGQSEISEITLLIDEDAFGDKLFDITVFYGTNKETQSVKLTIEDSTTGGLSSLFDNFGDNWFIWAIVLVNIVLIVAIIIVALKMSRS